MVGAYPSFNDVPSDDGCKQPRQVGQTVGERHQDTREARGEVQMVHLLSLKN